MENNKYDSYIFYLRSEYDKLCKILDKTTEEKEYRKVCIEMFDGLIYDISDSKLEILRSTLENFRVCKEKII